MALLLCAYLGLWMYSIRWFERTIDSVYANAEEEGVRFLGPKPGLSNFPFVPEVYYRGGFQIGNAIISFPEMKLRGYPVPGLPLSVSFPAGIALDGIADPAVWMLDGLEADVIIPWYVPNSLEYEDLAAWRGVDGKIDFRRYALTKQEMQARGSGLLTLDEDLQPVFHFESRLTGYDGFIESNIQTGSIEPLPGGVALAILNGLAKTDGVTGEKSVDLTISVENRILRAGPLQVLELPRFEWDRRSSPAPHQ